MKTLIKRVRVEANDRDDITYDDDEVLFTLNNGIRYIRRTIADLRPELLASEPVTGTLKAGESRITLPRRPLSFLYVRVGDEVKSKEEVKKNTEKVYHNRSFVYGNHTLIFSVETVTRYRLYKIPETNMMDIHCDLEQEGKPEVFYRSGVKTLNLYPVPDKETNYEIRPIDDIEELGADDTSPLLTEFDDVLVEYAAMRLHVRNEYDVSTDASITGDIYSQIVNLLGEPPAGMQTQGYWDAAPVYSGDYGNRGRW